MPVASAQTRRSQSSFLSQLSCLVRLTQSLAVLLRIYWTEYDCSPTNTTHSRRLACLIPLRVRVWATTCTACSGTTLSRLNERIPFLHRQHLLRATIDGREACIVQRVSALRHDVRFFACKTVGEWLEADGAFWFIGRRIEHRCMWVAMHRTRDIATSRSWAAASCCGRCGSCGAGGIGVGRVTMFQFARCAHPTGAAAVRQGVDTASAATTGAITSLGVKRVVGVRGRAERGRIAMPATAASASSTTRGVVAVTGRICASRAVRHGQSRIG